MSYLKIFIIIPVFNRRKITRSCLKQLSSQTIQNFEVIVVNDGSKDGTKEMVEEEFPLVDMIQGNGNWWWTKSINQGCKKALSSGAKIILLMNDDIIFDNYLIENIFEVHKKNPESIFGPLQLINSDQIRVSFAGMKEKIKPFRPSKGNRYCNKDAVFRENMFPNKNSTVFLPGRCMLIPSFVFDSIGFFDEDGLPQYGADYDFTMRAHERGIEVFVSNEIRIFEMRKHTGKGASYNSRKITTVIRSFFNKYSRNNISTQYYYYKRHYSKIEALYLTLETVFRIFYAIFRYKISNKKLINFIYLI